MTELKYFNNKTPMFSLNGIKTEARVVDVIDGDTLALVFPIFNKYFKFHIRLNGIDTCEIHSKNEILKTKGLKAKRRMIELLYPLETIEDNIEIYKKQILSLFDRYVSIVWLECLEFDKYGRLLGNVFIKDKKLNVCDVLIDEKLAYRYDGSTKLSKEEQENL
jgi:endonuclease YncB( thermonuclease family)